MVAISQSGETADTLVSMEAARAAGAPIMGIVNVVGSQAARLALASAGVLYTRAGPEIGVASTKAFTSQLVALALLALHLGGVREAIEPDAAAPSCSALEALPDQAAAVLGHTEPASRRRRPDGHGLAALAARYEALAARYHRAQDVLYIGRGGPVSHRPGGRPQAEGDQLHPRRGLPRRRDEARPDRPDRPRRARGGDRPARPRLRQDALQHPGGAGARGAGDRRRHRGRRRPRREGRRRHLPCPTTDPRLAPMLATIPLQLLAYYVAVRRGCDVDQPRNLAKSVTVE